MEKTKFYTCIIFILSGISLWGQGWEFGGGVRYLTITGTNLTEKGYAREKGLSDIDVSFFLAAAHVGRYFPLKFIKETQSVGIYSNITGATAFGATNADYCYLASVPVHLTYRFAAGNRPEPGSNWGLGIGCGAELNAAAFGFNFGDMIGYDKIYVSPSVMVEFCQKIFSGDLMKLQLKSSLTGYRDNRYDDDSGFHYGTKIIYYEVSIAFTEKGY